jgi:plastocyanin
MRSPIHFCIATLAALGVLIILLSPTLTQSRIKPSASAVNRRAETTYATRSARDSAAQTFNVLVGPSGSRIFSPATLTIQIGDTVHWNWASDSHSVTSGTCGQQSCTPDGRFDSGVQGAEASFDMTFTRPGPYPYYCSVHGSMMTGTIIVAGQNFTSSLSPAQEVPAPVGNPMGSGTGIVTLNAAENQITVDMSYVGMSSNVTDAHIHGSATSTPGNTGPIIFGLKPTGGTEGHNTATVFDITPAQVALLRSNRLYFNVHTVNNPNGECRGQIHLYDAARDFDADGLPDLSVFRPSDGFWYIQRSSTNSLQAAHWGLSDDVLVQADYDGDGQTDFAVFRNGVWYILPNIGGDFIAASWGLGTDIPVPGDYDKDGRTDLAVFRHDDPSAGVATWYILKSSDGSFIAQQWGLSTDKPVPGDYDGDGRTDVAVFRPSNGYWYILQSSNNTFVARQWGLSTDKPVPGDYDGDGRTDVAVLRQNDPSAGVVTWYITKSSNGSSVAPQWGFNTDTPVQGDYNSDGKTDVAVWRPSTGVYYILGQFGGSQGLGKIPVSTDTNWGQAGDRPLHYVPEQ